MKTLIKENNMSNNNSGKVIFGVTNDDCSFIVSGLDDGRIELKAFKEGRTASVVRLRVSSACELVNAIDLFASEQSDRYDENSLYGGY